MDGEKLHDAVCVIFGEALLQVVAEGREVTKESVADTIKMLADDQTDLQVAFALDLLRR